MRPNGLLSPLSLLIVLFSTFNAQADWGAWQTYAIVDFGDGNHFRAGGLNADVAVDYEAYYYGLFKSSDTFILNGGEMKTYKNGSSNACGGSMYYRVYNECETPGAFSSVALGFLDAFPSAGLPNAGDQKWGASAANVNLLSGLSKGDYILEVYWEVDGNQTNSSGCGEFKYDSNSGSNYLAYFSVGEEGFTDGDHTTNSAWTGDTGDFSVIDPTSLTADGSNTNINDADHQNNDVLVSNLGSTDAALVHNNTQAYGVWEFSVATGLNWNTSATNNFMFVLSSDSNDPADLIIDSGSGAPNFNGYGLRYTNVAGDLDYFELVKFDGTSSTAILDTNYPEAANAYDGYTVKIVRSTDGDFDIYIDQGFDNTDATTLRGSIRDNDHATSVCSAIVLNAGSAGAARRLYFDNLVMGAATEVSFDVAAVDIQETDADFTHNITVNIANADAHCETTADIALISGDATRVDNYTTQSITFPAGSSAAIDVPITISSNTTCERNETLIFTLQNVAAGCSAISAGNVSTTIELDDDESGTEVDLAEDFEDNDNSDWLNNANWPTISSSATISGQYDVRHTNASGGLDYVVKNMCNLNMRAVETTWTWNMRKAGLNTSSANWFMYVIASNQAEVWDAGGSLSSPFNSTFDGYAVGMNFNTTTDNLKLVRIDDGVVTDMVVSTYLWPTNITLGIKVVRNETGSFEFFYQENGGFDAMNSVGSATDNNYLALDYFVAATELTSSNSGKIRFDDLKIEQYGCFETWFTTGTGNASASIWSQNDLDVVGSTLEFGRFKNLVNQDGHTLTIDTEVVSHDFQIEPTGITDLSSNNLFVNRDFVNSGSFNANTGTVEFQPYGTGTIGGATTTEFNDINLSGRGTLLLDNDVDLRGTLRPNKGIFDTGGLNFRLISDATSDAAIGEIKADASFVGDVNLERHIPAGNQIWFNVGNPITGVDFNDWNDDITTTGFSGSDWPFWDFNNIRSYNETTGGNLDAGFEGAADINNTLNTDNGYMMYLESAAQNIEVTGGIQSGDITQNLSYTSNVGMTDDGWNLVVNRYPSEINWDLLHAGSTGIGSTYWVHAGDGFSGTRNYVFYDAVSGLGTAGAGIATSQSFWVKVDAAGGQLNWSETVKSESGASFQRAYELLPQLGLKLVGESSADYTYVVFDDDMSGDYDSGRDAFHIGGGENWSDFNDEDAPIGLSTIGQDDHPLSINNLGWIDAESSIPVRISVIWPQALTISSQNVAGLPESACLSIEDLETGIIYPFNEEFELTFELSEPFVGIRFMIHSSAPLDVASQNMTCSSSNDGSASATAIGNGPFIYTWYDEMGAMILTETTSSTSSINDLPLGNYVVIVEGIDAFCDDVQHTFYIDNPALLMISSTHESDVCVNGDAWIQIEGSTADLYMIELYDQDGDLVLTESDTFGTTMIEGLAGGVYSAIVTTSCDVFELDFDLADPMAVIAEIDTQDVELILEGDEVNIEITSTVVNANNVAWYLNGLLVGDLETLQLTFDQAGTYELMLSANGDACSLNDMITIVVLSADFVGENLQNELIIMSSIDAIQFDVYEALNYSAMRIFNAAGQLVLDQQMAGVSGRQVISTKELSQGVYTLTLISTAGSSVGQFVK